MSSSPKIAMITNPKKESPLFAHLGHATEYIDRILEGATVAELPLQPPPTCQMIINPKAAKVLGREVSPTRLATADVVIE
jgi:ABC-type uncharacterized transport system substrate-binding protein